MKKTIALLLAAASMAMGATKVDLTEKWADNTAKISTETFTNGAATVIFTLNLDALKKWSASTGNIQLGYLSGVNSSDSSKMSHMGVALSSKYNEISTWKNNGNFESYHQKVCSMPLPSDIDGKNYSYATVFFTLETNKNNTLISAYLYLLDEELGEVIDFTTGLNKTLTSTMMDGQKYTDFTINPEYVNMDQVALYNGKIETETEKTEAIKALFQSSPNPTIPEPTTATLSLLALAGLAARRRRR